MNNPLRRHKRTMRVFYPAYGYGPWMCHYCDRPIEQIGRGRWDGNVHHLDGDVTNDVAENLAIAHALCHQRQHPVTEVTKQQISEKLRGRPSPTKGMRFSHEINARKGRPGELNPFFGQRHSDAALTKMRQPRRRIECERCGRDYAINWIRRHACVS